VSNLKEDEPVDIRTAMTPTNLLLWTLLALLVIWLVIFAYLALKREQTPAADDTQNITVPRSVIATSAQQQLQKFTAVPAKAATIASNNNQEEVVLERSLG
jgi:hypothetical protein